MGFFSNLSQEKSPTAEILGNYFPQTIVPTKYIRKISAVGLFCCDKFEETPKQKVIDLSKLKNLYFNIKLVLKARTAYAKVRILINVW